MISLHSIMATGSASNLPMIVGIMSGIMLALAFIVGFVKGFRKVSWDGLIWATAAALFSFVGFLIEPTGMTVRRVAIIILFTLLYIVAALAVYGLLAHYLRPQKECECRFCSQYNRLNVRVPELMSEAKEAPLYFSYL